MRAETQTCLRCLSSVKVRDQQTATMCKNNTIGTSMALHAEVGDADEGRQQGEVGGETPLDVKRGPPHKTSPPHTYSSPQLYDFHHRSIQL